MLGFKNTENLCIKYSIDEKKANSVNVGFCVFLVNL